MDNHLLENIFVTLNVQSATHFDHPLRLKCVGSETKLRALPEN